MSIVIPALLLLAGCQSTTTQLEQLLAVDIDDNAFLSVCVTLDSDTPVVDGKGSMKRLEFPAQMDTSKLTREEINDLLDCP